MDFSSLTPLAGGWSGETFVAGTPGERIVVRIYGGGSRSRGADAAGIDAAVLRLVRGLLPVPEVLEVRPADPAADTPAVLVTSFVPGVRGDELLPTLDAAGLARAGQAAGALAAALGGMPMLRPGPFVDDGLRIGSFGVDGLPAFVAALEPDLAHLTPDELDGLRTVAVDAQTLLDTVPRTCLVHSDLNPKNLLLDPDTQAVTGVLDWEFAHAGHPFTDLGNLLRFDREPVWVEGVLGSYADQRGVPATAALPLARAADLWALADLAARRHASPVAAHADRLLRAVARARDADVALPE